MGQWDVTNMGTLFLLIKNMPPYVSTLQLVVMILVFTDTILGVVVACIEGKMRSRTLAIGLLSKLSCYFGIKILGLVGAILAKSWIPFTGTYGCILLIEFSSMTEFIIILAKLGKIKVEPIKDAIETIAPWFEVYKTGTKEKRLSKGRRETD